jgi:hypothetical protein
MCVDAENVKRADIGMVVQIFYRARPIFLRNELIHSGRGGSMEWQYRGGIINLTNNRRDHHTAPHRTTTPRRSTFREAFLPSSPMATPRCLSKRKFLSIFGFF